MSIKWLDRRIAALGPYLTLCLNESEFKQALKQLDEPPLGYWISKGSDAAAHHLSNKNGEVVCILCIHVPDGKSPIEIAGLLVHEAVHVFQKYCQYIGEDSPASEQEAYGIQHISQTLMGEYARRIQEQKT